MPLVLQQINFAIIYFGNQYIFNDKMHPKGNRLQNVVVNLPTLNYLR